MTAPALLFRRTGGEDFPDRLKVMISGPPKSGKTSLLGTVPNIVIADTEPHANNLQSIAHKNVPYVPVNGTADLQRLLVVLRDESMRTKAAASMGMPDIEAVAIDTLDTLQKIMKRERMREQRTSKFLRDDWGWLKEEMTSLLSAFTALPLHVFFVVHVKTKDIGTEDDPQTIILPGLEGSIAEEVAGMVGYSLLAFRKQEIRKDGSPYTKYWLRAEGDETYNFLGNRAAGRLPDVIEPDFRAIYDAAFSGRKALPAAQPAIEISQTAPAVAPAAAPAPVAEEVVQTSDQQSAQPVEQPVEQPVQAAQEQATPDGQPAAARPGDGEPINAAALGFCKRVYDAVGLEFPEELIKGLSLGQARDLVRYWQAVQQDAVEGNLNDSPSDAMTEYLSAQGWLSAADASRRQPSEQPAEQPAEQPTQPAPQAPVADRNGTIEQVMAFVDGDLAKAQEVYDQELRKTRPRATLITALTNLGVQVQTPVQTTTATPEVTPAPAAAETPEAEAQMQAAEVTLAENLGAVPITEDGTPLPCEECGDAVDDEDIAVLSKSRFNRRLCTADYIAQTKKPRS